MTKEQSLLEEARKHAYSFPGLTPPNNAVFIGAVDMGNDIYFYYRDETGNFYYDSQGTRRFELEMKMAREKKKRKKSHISGSLPCIDKICHTKHQI